MRAAALVFFGLAGLPCVAAASPAAKPQCHSTVTGDVRVHSFASRVFGNRRMLRVLVPAGYESAENGERRYPVLYLLDGQNLFDACLSDVSHREWGVDETVDRLVPYKDFVGNPKMPEPAGRRFPDFLANEVMPFVDAHYRTLRGHANTGIGGSSYGGVAALYTLLARPNDFGYGLIESPTLWVGMGQLVRDTSPLIAMPVKVFIGFGGREADDPKIAALLIGLVRNVEANFRAAGYDDTNLRVVIDPDAVHNEDAWAKRLPDALTFLFGGWQAVAP